MWDQEENFNLLRDIIISEFDKDCLFECIKDSKVEESIIFPLQFAELDPYKVYRMSQASRILKIRSNILRYYLNNYNDYIQAKKNVTKYVFTFRSIYKLHLIHICLNSDIMININFKDIMGLLVSQNDFIDRRLTTFTNKFLEMTEKDNELDSKEAYFFLLYMQFCELTTELNEEIHQYNMTLTTSPLTIDETYRTKLLTKKDNQDELFQALHESYITV